MTNINKDAQVSIRLTREELKLLKSTAKSRGMHAAEFVRNLIRRELFVNRT